MKRRWLWPVIGANLVAVFALVFVYPNFMVSPGPLRPEHASLATRCFACHAPLRGPSADRCIDCHAVADIGRRTTQGAPVKAHASASSAALKIAFHQELTEPDCMACHGDHTGPRLAPTAPNRFTHALLRTATRSRCELCHAPPETAIHRDRRQECAQCHNSTAWKPATFDHSRLFVLDGAHNVECTTCHVGGDFKRYTCYGCHEHTPARVREQHREEGIADIGDCARCHRSAGERREGD
jgi:Class III cytochrome C family